MNKDKITVLNGRVLLQQPEGGFRTSIDAVLLAASCPARNGDHILDLGCGVGSAGLCVLARVQGTELTGIEIQQSHKDLAVQNAIENGMAQQCDFIAADIRDMAEQWKHAPGKYDHVICNPPFLEAGTHLQSPDASRAKALGHDDKDLMLDDWIRAGFYSLKNGGSMTIIHRADHCDKIIQALGTRFGKIEIIPLWPREGQNAKRVIIRSIKNVKTPASLHSGIILHEDNGDYTNAANAILRDMQAI